jgi:large subunit ribosomal protein L4
LREKEVKKVVIPEEDYYFPPLNMAVGSLQVKDWFNPGKFVSGSTAVLDPRVFNVAIRKDLVHEMIRYQRAKVRQPHKTKRIGEISGSTKKPRPQKGGGTGQVGNKRNSAWRKGQKAHGPVLRSFAFDLNRKMRAKALMTVLAAKHREGNLHVFNRFDVQGNKTKDLVKLARSHGLLEPPGGITQEEEDHGGTKWRAMLCCDDMSANMVYSAANVQQIILMPQSKMSVIDLMRFDTLAISEKALEGLQQRLVVQMLGNNRRLNSLKQHTVLTHSKLMDRLEAAAEEEEAARARHAA